jgi:threonine dehydratase
MTIIAAEPFTLTVRDFEEVRARIAPHIKRTPLLTSRQLSELTGYDIRLKAEMPEEDKRRGVVCSSAGNHAQGVALAAKIHGIRAVVCMAKNATPAKIAATKAYGAEVVLHGMIWDEANEKAKELVRNEGLTYVHPFDDPQLIAGQGTLGLEIAQDWPEVDAVVVPIGGGGLISGDEGHRRRIVGRPGDAAQPGCRPPRDDRLPHDHRRVARTPVRRAQLLSRPALRGRDRRSPRPRDLRRDDLGDGAV